MKASVPWCENTRRRRERPTPAGAGPTRPSGTVHPAEDAPPSVTGHLPCSSGELLRVALLSGVLVLLFYAFGTERVGLRTDDAGQYYRMAESPSYLARLWYSFRVLTPLLAAAWPGDPLVGFSAVTVVSLVLACVALYAYQRVLGLSAATAVAGALLFSVSGGPIRLLTTPVYVDAATYLSEAAAFLFLAAGRFRPFLVAVVMGVLNRETALLLVPLYFVAAPPGWRTGARDRLVAALPVGVLAAIVVVKLWLGGVLAGPVPLAQLAPYSRAFALGPPSPTALFDLFSAFGVLWFLALKNLPGSTPFPRRALVFGALVILQLAIARGDEGRVLSHLFPIVIPLAMLEVERLLGSWPRRAWLPAAVLVAACAASMVHARWIFLDSAPLRYTLVAVGTIVALALSASTALRGRAVQEPSSSGARAEGNGRRAHLD